MARVASTWIQATNANIELMVLTEWEIDLQLSP
jgi:hypothetical protein